MTTNKYTRDFNDFQSSPWPGKNIPENYNHTLNAGDGNPGLQWMFQSGLAAYGPRHVIAGIAVQTGAANSVTGTAGYYMWDGEIKAWTAASGVIAANQYAYISGNGTLNFASTGEYNSGLMIAVSGVGGIKNITQRWEANKLLYNYVDKLHALNITGIHANIGFETISGTQITGTYATISDAYIDDCEINDLSSLNDRIYHISSEAELTGVLATIGNSNIGSIIYVDSSFNVNNAPIDIDNQYSHIVIDGYMRSIITNNSANAPLFRIHNSASVYFRNIEIRQAYADYEINMIEVTGALDIGVVNCKLLTKSAAPYGGSSIFLSGIGNSINIDNCIFGGYGGNDAYYMIKIVDLVNQQFWGNYNISKCGKTAQAYGPWKIYVSGNTSSIHIHNCDKIAFEIYGTKHSVIAHNTRLRPSFIDEGSNYNSIIGNTWTGITTTWTGLIIDGESNYNTLIGNNFIETNYDKSIVISDVTGIMINGNIYKSITDSGKGTSGLIAGNNIEI